MGPEEGRFDGSVEGRKLGEEDSLADEESFCSPDEVVTGDKVGRDAGCSVLDERAVVLSVGSGV